ncbi:MAG: aldo/keto reductase [Deltaproteobacteria bacterium]|nr:aldo/keto reductase [Deltaproteobacteria bacterium]
MQLSRRELLKAGIAAGASIFLPSAGLLAQAVPLIQRKIPSTGESLPIIGLGTARRYEAITTEAERAPLRETLRRFKALGGRVIDSSPTYGVAERVVGDLVAELKIRDSLFIATKVSTRGREAGLEQLEQSFKRLQMQKIDLIAVHNLRDTQIQLGTLREWKQAGRIRYLGITTSSEKQYREFGQTMKAEALDFIQVDYALDNREADKRILPLAADRGMAVMINLPFGRGRLFNAVQGQKLPQWASDFDCKTWAQFFLKYIVSHPAVTCAVPGMAKAEYVADNLEAARGRLPDLAMRRRMESFIDGL